MPRDIEWYPKSTFLEHLRRLRDSRLRLTSGEPGVFIHDPENGMYRACIVMPAVAPSHKEVETYNFTASDPVDAVYQCFKWAVQELDKAERSRRKLKKNLDRKYPLKGLAI